jgi:DNA polymerase-4
VCVPARFELYLEISRMVKSIYREYSDRVESFGIDESWIDISHMVNSYEDAVEVANNIRCRIIAEIGLTVSIGISFNKVFAKLGSDLKKPNATVLITEENYKEKVWNLPVEDLLYVGRATNKKLKRANINTIGDLAKTDKKYLKLTLGKMGLVLWEFANGIDSSEVSKISDKEKIKSFGNSTTCPINLSEEEQVKSIIYMLSESVASRMRERGYYAKGVSLWVKDTNLQSFDRQMILPSITNVSEDIAKSCMKLFKEHFNWHLDVRALGVRVTHLTDGNYQDDLFNSGEKLEKKQSLELAIEGLRGRYGYNIIRRGNILSYAELSPLNPHSEIHIIHPKGFFKGKL